MLQTDKIIRCEKTGQDLCYVTEPTPGITNYMSLSSGFWTNNLMKEGSTFLIEQFSKLPELYKDISWKSPTTGLVWLPNTVNIPTKGMVFANGKDSTNWGWAAVKAIDVKEEEKEKYPIPNQPGKFYSKRMDMTTLTMFPQESYLEALDFIGVLGQE